MDYQTGPQPNSWFPESDHVPQFRLYLPGVGEQIDTPDQLRDFGHRLGDQADAIRKSHGDRATDDFLDYAAQTLICERIE
jgi:hypothetical protein